MPKNDQIIYGAPCWVDLTNTDIEGTKSFYNALFGWDFADMGEDFGHYNIITIGEDAVGGAMQYSPEFMGPNPINAWSVYFSAPSAEEAVASAVAHGGTVMAPPMQVAEQGTNAVVFDATGAEYGIWQPDQRVGFDRWGEHGFPGWFEMQTRDLDASVAYYSSVLPVELGDEPMPEGMSYKTLNINGQPHAGIYDATTVMPESVPNYWTIYFIVNDTDTAVAIAQAHGGTLVMPAMDSPHGRMAGLTDPAGAFFFVINDDES
ncbi:MAG: VOC family protein [Thermomicrobiales bacterium]|nr:VOC family protein [Thermomicrobiales bacterium]MCO5224249.1 VOC family protein [Thermomicrobiales bacterium]